MTASAGADVTNQALAMAALRLLLALGFACYAGTSQWVE